MEQELARTEAKVLRLKREEQLAKAEAKVFKLQHELAQPSVATSKVTSNAHSTTLKNGGSLSKRAVGKSKPQAVPTASSGGAAVNDDHVRNSKVSGGAHQMNERCSTRCALLQGLCALQW